MKVLAKVQDTDAGVQGHKLACKFVVVAMCYDQLQRSALASLELAARQVQLYEERWEDKVHGAIPAASLGAHLHTGMSSHTPGVAGVHRRRAS
jgi:hypothetical protein